MFFWVGEWGEGVKLWVESSWRKEKRKESLSHFDTSTFPLYSHPSVTPKRCLCNPDTLRIPNVRSRLAAITDRITPKLHPSIHKQIRISMKTSDPTRLRPRLQSPNRTVIIPAIPASATCLAFPAQGRVVSAPHALSAMMQHSTGKVILT